MDLKEIYHKIESHDTSGQLNLAPNLRHFFLYAEKLVCVQELRNLPNDPETITATLMRILSLVNEDIDIRYENPYDTAITIYLWDLFLRSEIVGKIAADYATRVRQGWWAPRYAQHVLKKTVFYTPAGIEEVQEARYFTYQDDDIHEMFFQFGTDKNLLTEVNWGQAASRYVIGTVWNDPWSQESGFQQVIVAAGDRPIKEAKRVQINADFKYEPPYKDYSQQDYLEIRCN